MARPVTPRRGAVLLVWGGALWGMAAGLVLAAILALAGLRFAALFLALPVAMYAHWCVKRSIGQAVAASRPLVDPPSRIERAAAELDGWRYAGTTDGPVQVGPMTLGPGTIWLGDAGQPEPEQGDTSWRRSRSD